MHFGGTRYTSSMHPYRNANLILVWINPSSLAAAIVQMAHTDLSLVTGANISWKLKSISLTCL